MSIIAITGINSINVMLSVALFALAAITLHVSGRLVQFTIRPGQGEDGVLSSKANQVYIIAVILAAGGSFGKYAHHFFAEAQPEETINAIGVMISLGIFIFFFMKWMKAFKKKLLSTGQLISICVLNLIIIEGIGDITMELIIGVDPSVKRLFIPLIFGLFLLRDASKFAKAHEMTINQFLYAKRRDVKEYLEYFKEERKRKDEIIDN